MTLHPLIRRQLRKAFPGGLLEHPGLTALIDSVSNAYIGADDDRRQLEHSLQLASEELVERNRKLEHQIEELTRLEKIVARRTAELDRRNQDMTLILDNVGQGFVTAGLDGTIGNECSRSMIDWFGAPSEGVPIWTYLAGYDPNLAAWVELGFGSLRDETMEREVVIDQLPRRLDRNGRPFRVEYRAIGKPLNALLVVVSDITDELARQRAEGAQRELLAVIEKAYRDRAGFVAFIHETNEVVRRNRTSVPLEELKRQIHTLKGNAALFGVTTVSQVCHDLETAMDADAAAPDQAAWAVLCDAWQAFHDRIDSLLGVSERRTVLVDWEEYQAVVAMLSDPEPSWATRIRRWGQDPTRSHLERFAEQAQQLAHRLDKAELDIEIRDHDLRLDAERFAPVWGAVVHAVNNAVDHGIEPTDQRIAVGKPARARMVLSTEQRDHELIVEIQDDGGGIDWHAVARRAAALGLPATTQNDLSDALLAGGLSTTLEVSETSGRGVGMSALRAICIELGGRVELTSEHGRGTTVRCVVPLTRTRSRSRNTPPVMRV